MIIVSNAWEFSKVGGAFYQLYSLSMIKTKCNFLTCYINVSSLICCLLEHCCLFLPKHPITSLCKRLLALSVLVVLSSSHLPFTCSRLTGHITTAPPHYVAPTAVRMHLGQHTWRQWEEACASCVCVGARVCVWVSLCVCVRAFFTVSWISSAKIQIETQSAA